MSVHSSVALVMVFCGAGVVVSAWGVSGDRSTIGIHGSAFEAEAKEDPPLQIQTQQNQTTAAAPAALASANAEKIRAEIRAVESLLPKIPDRGAALFLTARRYIQLGDLQKGLALLKECVALDAGFEPDPSRHPSLRPLASNAELRELLEQARRGHDAVHKAHVAFTVPDKDLFPEGLAVDVSNGSFYMSSMHHKKIVKFTLNGRVSDFVKQGAYDLMPVGGVHVDPADQSVWAATDPGEKKRSELVHFSAKGELLERYTAPGIGPHDLNDLVLNGGSVVAKGNSGSPQGAAEERPATEIFTTDTDGNHVYRFDRTTHKFNEMKLWRPVFYPNGITVSGGGTLLFVADMLGVIRVDLRTNESADVDPGAHDTLCGIDGLYWNNGELIGVQYGTGVYRVMRWRLSADGRKVTSSEILEYGTELVSDPTTGAILGDNFYFMANTGIYNLEDDKIVDPAKLEPVKIAVVGLK